MASTQAPTPRIEGYEILETLGAGSAGTVYRARQLELDRVVALKVLRVIPGDEPQSERRFTREARQMVRLNHPNLVHLLAFGDTHRPPYIAMELVDGGTLRGRIAAAVASRSDPPILPVAEVIRLAREMLGALEALHGAGLIHRDLKPMNIFVRDSGEFVLGDLSLVHTTSHVETQLTATGQLLGTLGYIAPEIYEGGKVSAASDLFALGITLYECFVGIHPTEFRPISRRFIPQLPVDVRRVVGPRLSDYVERLMSPDPARRPRDASQARDELEQTQGAPPRTFSTGSAAERAARRRRDSSDRSPPVETNQQKPRVGLRVLGGAALLIGAWAAMVIGRGPARIVPPELVVQRRVTVLGVQRSGPSPLLWLASPDRVAVRSGPTSSITTLSPTSTAVALPTDNILHVEITRGRWVTLKLVLPPELGRPSGPRLPGFGLIGSLTPPVAQINSDLGTEGFDEWLTRSGAGWFGSVPDRVTGRSTLNPATFAALYRRAGIRTLLTARVSDGTDATQLETDLIALDRARIPGLSVVLEPLGLDELFVRELIDTGTAGLLTRWKKRLFERAPGLVTRPYPVPLLFLPQLDLMHHDHRTWGKPDAVTFSDIHDSVSYLEQKFNGLKKGVPGDWSAGDIRWVWIRSDMMTAAEILGASGSGMPHSNVFGAVRAYIAARRLFGRAVILVDHAALMNRATGKVTIAWTHLELAARLLDGLPFAGNLPLVAMLSPGARDSSEPGPRATTSSSITPAAVSVGSRGPRLEGPRTAMGLNFSDGTRRVQVIQSDTGRRKVRFTPGRPGLLWTLPSGEVGTDQSRLIVDLAPIDLEVSHAPTFFEELTAIQAQSSSPAELIVDRR